MNSPLSIYLITRLILYIALIDTILNINNLFGNSYLSFVIALDTYEHIL